MDHQAYASDIAPRAAELYGQSWNELEQSARDIWINTVRDTEPFGGQTLLEKRAGEAVAEWYKREITTTHNVEPETETKKSKRK